MRRRVGFIVLVTTLTASVEMRAAASVGIDRPGQDRIVSVIPIGGSAYDPANRNVGSRLRDNGWINFVEDFVKPQIEWGARRIHLHNPFGILPWEPMQADQYIEARDAGLDWLYRDFVEAWKPVTSGALGVDVEVIAYLGSFKDDWDFVRLQQNGYIESWRQRAEESISLPLGAGMSLAFDQVANTGPEHPAYGFARDLRDRGVEVYVEGWSLDENDHWSDFNYFLNHRLYASVVGEDGYQTPDDVTGEIHHRVGQPDFTNWPTLEQELTHWREILSKGEVANGRVWKLMEAGVTLDELLSPLDEAAPMIVPMTAPTPEPGSLVLFVGVGLGLLHRWRGS